MIVIASAILSFLFFYTIYINWSLKGPFVLPLLGSPEALFYISNLRVHEFFDLIQQRSYGKVVCVKFLGIEEFNIIDAQEGLRVLRELKRPPFLHEASVGIMDYALFAMKTDSVWKAHRQAIQPSFSPAILRSNAKNIYATALDLIAVLERDQKSSKDILALMNATALDSLAQFAFGESVGALLNPTAKTVWTDLSNITLKPTVLRFSVPKFLWGHFGLGQYSPQIVRNRERIHKYLNEVIERAKLDKSEGDEKKMNIMDRLLAKQDSGKLRKEEVFGEVLGFFIAGTDTTASTLTFVILELCRNPDIQQKLYQEIKDFHTDPNDDKLVERLNSLPFLNNVIQESQRLHPTVGSTDRESDSTQVLFGTAYPPKTRFVVSMRVIHLSEEYWIEPLRFNPDRWITDEINPSAFMPFGDGPRNCIGQKFALIEVKLVLVMILKKFRFKMDEKSMLSYTNKLTYNVDGFRAYVSMREEL